MSTDRSKHAVSEFLRQSCRRYDSVETRLTEAGSIASCDFTHVLVLRNYLCTLVCMSLKSELCLPADNSTDVVFLCDNNLIQMIIERCFVTYDKDGRKVLDLKEARPFFFYFFFPYE